MGTRTQLNQRGMTIFEMSIVLLILVLVGVSLWLIVMRIHESSRRNYNNTPSIPSTEVTD